MTNSQESRSFWLSATKSQARDTGMALVLVCLLAAWLGGRRGALGLGIVLLVLDMAWPSAFKPAAKIWLGFSHLLGTVMSKVLLAVVFFTVLTPIGLLRRVFGKDSMRLRDFKTSSASVFRVRDHRFSSKDIETPY